VGLVLAVREQAPEQDCELARDGDDRDPVAAAGADPLIQGVQRAGLVDDRPGRLDERPARRGRTLLWRSRHRPPARCRTGARAVKAEVADQRSRCAEATARRPTRPVETDVPGCMELDRRRATAAFHGCTSAVGPNCAPADAWSSSFAWPEHVRAEARALWPKQSCGRSPSACCWAPSARTRQECRGPRRKGGFF
jgi:hypothetical protein